MPNEPKRLGMVVFGTDGNVDYVQMSDGQKYTLGPVSVVTLVGRLVSPTRAIRQVLDQFTKTGQAMAKVDLDKLWELLPYRRARFSSSATPVENGDHMHKSASFDNFTANTETVEDILDKVATTNRTIDRLVKAGKRFDSVRAKGDLLRIASRVADIADTVDLALAWVGNDLSELHREASEIHSLFPVDNED